jgi:hypothetical protein
MPLLHPVETSRSYMATGQKPERLKRGNYGVGLRYLDV